MHGGVLALTSRKGTEITVRYPEVARLPAALAGHDAVVDGEIVAMDDQGRPDFGALQNRMHRTGPEVPRMAAAQPVTYLVFDLLAWDGEDLLGRPYAERRRAAGRARARRAPLGGHAVVRRRRGAACWPPARRTGSRASSPSGWTRRTGPGLRSPDWRKIKNFRTQAVVVGGWRPGQGRRAGDDRLAAGRRPGRRGAAGLRRPRRHRLQRPGPARPAADVHRPDDRRRSRARCPREVTRDAHWVEPDLVGEVAYAVWTADNRLRHPAWRGVRDDLEPDDVVVEP